MIHSAKAGVGKASSNLTEDWEELLTKLKRVFEQLSKAEGTMAFSFVEVHNQLKCLWLSYLQFKYDHSVSAGKSCPGHDSRMVDPAG